METTVKTMLKEINGWLNYQMDKLDTYEYDMEDYKRIIRIFADASFYMLYLNNDKKVNVRTLNEVEQFGKDLHELILKYTGFNTHTIDHTVFNDSILWEFRNNGQI